MSENPSYDSVPLENITAIQEIIAKMQEEESFYALCDEAQVRLAKKIDQDPLGFAMHTLQTVKNGLDQKDPLMHEAEMLLKLALKVASEYTENHWLVRQIAHALGSMGTKDANEVRKHVLEVLGDS